jgi:UDP-GlcNAc:undecaprenyl-phosphate GlcNAc-1-phosphate transferase
MPHSLMLLAAFASALVVTFALTPLVAAYARRVGLVDAARSRTGNDSPVPRVGGVAVFIGLVVGLIAYTAALGVENLWMLIATEGRVSLLVPCAIVLLMGLIDDIHGLTPHVKVVVQAGAAMICMHAGFMIDELWTAFGVSIPLGPLRYPLTLLWFIGVTNAYNLIDGLDGLFPCMGVASLAGIAVLAVSLGMDEEAVFAVALAGALAALLFWSRHPARITAGDGGAYLTGLAIAALALDVSKVSAGAGAGVGTGTTGSRLCVMLCLCALPAADTLYAVFRRVKARRSIFKRDRRHIHHLLALGRGWSVGRSVLVLGGLQVALVGGGVWLRLGWWLG